MPWGRRGAVTGRPPGRGDSARERTGLEPGELWVRVATGTAGGAADGTAAGGGMAVCAGAGPGDFASFVSSGLDAALPAVAGERGSAVPPKDGIDTNSRRRPAAARAFLTTHPTKKPPGKQYKLLFYLTNSALSRVRLRSPPPKEPGDGSVGTAIPSTLFIVSAERGEKFTPAGDLQRDTGSYSPPSRGRWADTGSSRARERISRARSR